MTNATAGLALANRILYAQHVLDAFGHVSMRSPERTDRFLLARNMAPALVKADDILEFDLDGELVGERRDKAYLERFIHSELYRHRPDVMSIVHSHSPSVIPFGVTNGRLRPICHMSGFLGSGLPTFEIRDVAADTDLLISNRALGEALARVVGQQVGALQRGHGCVVVAGSLQEAVFRAVYLEKNARLQLESATLGQITFLSDGESIAATKSIRGQIDRAWDLWVHELGGSLPD